MFLRLARRATADLKRLPQLDRERMLVRLGDHAATPRSGDQKSLEGFPGLHRLRSGKWRALYSIEDDGRTILVHRIRHRAKAYGKGRTN